MDTTLLRITEQTEHSMAGCPFVQVTGEEYAMPSAMHELSSAAACFTGPVTSNSATAWKRAHCSGIHDRRCAAAAGVLYQCRHDTAGLGVVAL